MLNTLSLSGEYGRRPHSLEAATTATNQISDGVASNSSSTVAKSKALAGNLTRMADLIMNSNRTAVNAAQMLNTTWVTGNNFFSCFLWYLHGFAFFCCMELNP